MKYIYFAQFLPAEKQGAYCVTFPDLQGCSTEGDSLAEALEMAKDCLTGYLKTCKKLEEEIPAPSSSDIARQKAEELCRELELDIPDGTFYQAVEADIIEKPVTLSVSMPRSIVTIIDRAAKQEGMTRSGFLAAAAKRYAQEVTA